jgi:hypothetical protein
LTSSLFIVSVNASKTDQFNTTTIEPHSKTV